jgi:hypothetical protein
MRRPALRTVALRYGCHDGRWTLPDADRPVIVAGPNGSGKSTLLAGILACLFGRPAQGAPRGGWAAVRLVRAGAGFEIERDLAAGTVVVRSLDDGAVHFEGVGDPRAGTHEAARYREILADLFGVGEAETYARTLFVGQGELAGTGLGEHLLRVAAGGHARMKAARRELARAHRAVTARPLHPGEPPGLDARELERVEAEIRALQARLESARRADARRVPLALDRERLEERVRVLAEETELLEEAHAALARGSAIEITARRLKELTGEMDVLGRTLPAAAKRLASARATLATVTADGHYPEDLPERLARAELRWRDLERIGRKRVDWLAVLALVLALGAAGLFAMETVPWPAVAVSLAAVMTLVAWGALWLDNRRDRARVRAELDRILAGVPGADRLPGGGRDRALRRFAAQRSARREWTEARAALAVALRDARRQLRAARMAGIDTSPPDPAEWNGSAPGPDSAERLAARIEAALARTRQRLVRERRELERVGDASLRLPDGVVPSADGVAEALRERRAERRRMEEALRHVGHELLERGTPAESLDALEAALTARLPRRDELVRKAEALEAAHALLTDAYDAFRARDQERLLRCISNHARELTNGQLGPVVAPAGLESARVRVRGRLVPPDSPPVSFGERQALHLAIRLGAAEFLGGIGVFPPVILDDPFAHLDRERAGLVWEMLCAMARDRQVIITSQDALLLDALGVEPDIDLGAASVATVSDGEAAA